MGGGDGQDALGLREAGDGGMDEKERDRRTGGGGESVLSEL